MRKFADLSGKRIIITGASSGIGCACAVLAAEMGASTVLVGRDRDRLECVRMGMADPDRHTVLVADLSEISSIAPAVSQIVSTGGVDGLVHAAGVCPVSPLVAADSRTLEKAMTVNTGAFFELMRRCTAKGAANAGFSAVAVSSVSASAGWAGGSVYAATKGALSAAVRSLAVELAPRGFRVNCISPSNIKTPMFEKLTAMNTPEAMAELEGRQPLGFGLAADVAPAAVFLLSSESAFITGVDLPVDGGYLAR